MIAGRPSSALVTGHDHATHGQTRPMKGWILVARNMVGEDDDLRRWVEHGITYAGSLPPK
jgi:hypothetical protein